MIRRAVLAVALAVAWIPARAVPVVDRVTGRPEAGAVLVAEGSGFGTRGDYHEGADKMARMFDDFNDGNLTECGYGNWRVFNAAEKPAVYSTDRPRTGRARDGFYRRTNKDLGFLAIGAGNRQEYYASFYMRLSDGFDVKSRSGGTHQFKIVRLYSSSTSDVNIYPAIGASDGFHMNTEFVRPQVMRYQLQVSRIPDKPAGWNKMAVLIRKSTRRDGNDGRLRVWWNNRIVFDWKDHFRAAANNPRSAPSYPITGDFDTDGKDLAGTWAVGNYFSSASGNTWADFDDVYLDHSQARVELGDAPRYADCAVLEVQPPVEWQDGRAAARVNLGALAGRETVYLYVIDSDGGVNADGFPVRNGGGVPNPPAAPAEVSPI